MHFKRIINDKWYKELEAEYSLCYRLVNMKMAVKILAQAREVYTKIRFQEFQEKLKEAIDLSIQNSVIEGECLRYTISMDKHSKKRSVKREINDILSCSCMMFEKKGVLCSHMVAILRDVMDIKEFLPSQYILKR